MKDFLIQVIYVSFVDIWIHLLENVLGGHEDNFEENCGGVIHHQNS